MNPFDVLEIKPGASADEIKAAYHRLAKQWHPDRFTGDEKQSAEDKFRQLAEAFSALKDAGARAEAAKRVMDSQLEKTDGQKDASSAKSAQEKTPADWLAEAKDAMGGNDHARALALVHHVLRLDGENGEAYALLAFLLDATGGDPRAKIKALENAVRINPKDVDSMLYLADAYQAQGMQARSARIREGAQCIAPKHPYFVRQTKQKSSHKETVKKEEPLSLGEQLSALLGRFFKKG